MQPQRHRVESLLQRLAADGEGTDAIAAQAVALWDDVGTALVPIIGQRGVSALLERAWHLAALDHPWLTYARPSDGRPPDGSDLARLLAGQTPAEAIAAITLLFDAFERVLVTLIGASLAERLLQPVWARDAAGPLPQDAPP